MAKRERPPLGRTAFTAPPPKGPRIRNIPRSTQYVPPPSDDEEAAFAAAGERPEPIGRTSRGRGRLAAAAARLTAAQRRMQGRLEDEASDDQSDEEPNEEPEEAVEIDDEGIVHVVTAVDVPNRTVTLEEQLRARLHPPAAASTTGGGSGATLPTIVASTTIPQLTARPIDIEAIDRLWDWIRGDTQQAFLGRTFRTTIELHRFMQALVIGERTGTSLVRQLLFGDDPVGIVMLAPILAQERTALVHLYLVQQVRGELANLVGPLMEIASQVYSGHLAIWSGDLQASRAFAKILGPLGFAAHTMFVR